MAGKRRGIRTALFAGGVGAALVFGASAVRGEARVPACNDPFANGSCTTTSACAKYCKGVVGAGTG